MTEAALARLCETYWYPLYAYARRRGYSAEDAQDLTQGFFARLLRRHWLADADQSKGRFRTFLLTAMERFLANEWDKARALKRGGGQPSVPLQLDTAETRYGIEPADKHTPEQAFEYRWALTLLDEVVRQHILYRVAATPHVGVERIPIRFAQTRQRRLRLSVIVVRSGQYHRPMRGNKGRIA